MKKLIVLLILVVPIYSYSQDEEIKDGYFYIRDKKIEGKLEFNIGVVSRFDIEGVTKLQYKKARLKHYDNQGNKINTYTVDDVPSFVIENDSFTTITGIKNSLNFKVKKGTEWAKVLINDELSLFKFSIDYRKENVGYEAQLASDDYLFIKKKGAEDYLMFQYSKNRTKQLAKLLSDYEELSEKIQQKKKIETFEELIEYINLYNTWSKGQH